MNILVAGFPYVRERYFATWRHTREHADNYRFVLPRRWPIKNGQIIYTAPVDPRVIPTTTLFTHSHYPIIGGLLKGWMPAFPLHLWRLRKRVDLVFACSEPMLFSTLYFAFWSKIFGKKFVCGSWENIPYEELFTGFIRWFHVATVKLNLALSDGFVGGNEESARIHGAYTKKPVGQFLMNGTDPHFFTPNLRMRTNKKFREYDWGGKLVYTFIGAIERRKGMQIAVQAFPRVHQTLPNAILVIAGTGPDEGYLQKEIDMAGIREHVVRMPWLDDKGVRDLMAVSDVFVYPGIPHGGWVEQFGFAMLEASQMELPVIATNKGSTPQAVKDGMTGILVEPNDVQAVVDAMIKLGGDPALRVQIGSAGRQYVVDHFSHEYIARRFYEFFTSLMNRKSPQA